MRDPMDQYRKDFGELHRGHATWHLPKFAEPDPEELDEFDGPLDGSIDRGEPLDDVAQMKVWDQYGMKGHIGFAPPSWALDPPKRLSEKKGMGVYRFSVQTSGAGGKPGTDGHLRFLLNFVRGKSGPPIHDMKTRTAAKVSDVRAVLKAELKK